MAKKYSLFKTFSCAYLNIGETVAKFVYDETPSAAPAPGPGKAPQAAPKKSTVPDADRARDAADAARAKVLDTLATAALKTTKDHIGIGTNKLTPEQFYNAFRPTRADATPVQLYVAIQGVKEKMIADKPKEAAKLGITKADGVLDDKMVKALRELYAEKLETPPPAPFKVTLTGERSKAKPTQIAIQKRELKHAYTEAELEKKEKFTTGKDPKYAKIGDIFIVDDNTNLRKGMTVRVRSIVETKFPDNPEKGPHKFLEVEYRPEDLHKIDATLKIPDPKDGLVPVDRFPVDWLRPLKTKVDKKTHKSEADTKVDEFNNARFEFWQKERGKQVLNEFRDFGANSETGRLEPKIDTTPGFRRGPMVIQEDTELGSYKLPKGVRLEITQPVKLNDNQETVKSEDFYMVRYFRKNARDAAKQEQVEFKVPVDDIKNLIDKGVLVDKDFVNGKYFARTIDATGTLLYLLGRNVDMVYDTGVRIPKDTMISIEGQTTYNGKKFFKVRVQDGQYGYILVNAVETEQGQDSKSTPRILVRRKGEDLDDVQAEVVDGKKDLAKSREILKAMGGAESADIYWDSSSGLCYIGADRKGIYTYEPTRSLLQLQPKLRTVPKEGTVAQLGKISAKDGALDTADKPKDLFKEIREKRDLYEKEMDYRKVMSVLDVFSANAGGEKLKWVKILWDEQSRQMYHIGDRGQVWIKVPGSKMYIPQPPNVTPPPNGLEELGTMYRDSGMMPAEKYRTPGSKPVLAIMQKREAEALADFTNKKSVDEILNLIGPAVPAANFYWNTGTNRGFALVEKAGGIIEEAAWYNPTNNKWEKVVPNYDWKAERGGWREKLGVGVRGQGMSPVKWENVLQVIEDRTNENKNRLADEVAEADKKEIDGVNKILGMLNSGEIDVYWDDQTKKAYVVLGSGEIAIYSARDKAFANVDKAEVVSSTLDSAMKIHLTDDEKIGILKRDSLIVPVEINGGKITWQAISDAIYKNRNPIPKPPKPATK